MDDRGDGLVAINSQSNAASIGGKPLSNQASTTVPRTAVTRPNME